jgi:hypothetical protein
MPILKPCAFDFCYFAVVAFSIKRVWPEVNIASDWKYDDIFEIGAVSDEDLDPHGYSAKAQGNAFTFADNPSLPENSDVASGQCDFLLINLAGLD